MSLDWDKLNEEMREIGASFINEKKMAKKVSVTKRFRELWDERAILDILEKKGALRRKDICKELGFESFVDIIKTKSTNGIIYKTPYTFYKGRTTIYDALVRLEKNNIVERITKRIKKIGRPPVYWKLKARGW